MRQIGSRLQRVDFNFVRAGSVCFTCAIGRVGTDPIRVTGGEVICLVATAE